MSGQTHHKDTNKQRTQELGIIFSEEGDCCLALTAAAPTVGEVVGGMHPSCPATVPHLESHIDICASALDVWSTSVCTKKC
jgi:hypothetical protein